MLCTSGESREISSLHGPQKKFSRLGPKIAEAQLSLPALQGTATPLPAVRQFGSDWLQACMCPVTVGNMKALFAQKALYSSIPILPSAAFPALPARGGAAGRPRASDLPPGGGCLRFSPRAIIPGIAARMVGPFALG
jgi:hypothetical protein